MKNGYILLLVLALMSACAVVPDEINVAEPEALTQFETISANKTNTATIGSKARWGGKIVAVQNKKEVSEIEIVYFPENHFGKPRVGEASIGRFKVIVSGFVDPLVFEAGRLITVVGEVDAVQTGVIGEQTYHYPTLKALGYHMWKDIQELDVETYRLSSFGFRSGFHRSFFTPWHDPFWDRRVRVKVIKNKGHSQGDRVQNRKPNTRKPDVKEPKPRSPKYDK